VRGDVEPAPEDAGWAPGLWGVLHNSSVAAPPGVVNPLAFAAVSSGAVFVSDLGVVPAGDADPMGVFSKVAGSIPHEVNPPTVTALIQVHQSTNQLMTPPPNVRLQGRFRQPAADVEGAETLHPTSTCIIVNHNCKLFPVWRPRESCCGTRFWSAAAVVAWSCPRGTALYLRKVPP
jgi:hypothetical protein